MSDVQKPPHDEEEHEEHLDERWLVSYADMMTLLFGLFVMLFSIASENQGNFKEQLQKISNSRFNTEVTETVKPTVAVPEKELEQDLAVELQALKEERKILENKVEQQKSLQVELQNKIDEKLKIESEMLAKVETAEKAKKNIEKQLDELNLKHDTKQSFSENMNSKNKKLEILNANLETEKLKIESKSKSLSIENQELKKQLSQEKQRDMQKQRQMASVEDKTEKLEAALKEKEQAIVEKEKIENELEKIQKREKEQPLFMMVVLKWTSEKHDLDLTVTDPNGKVFNFKNRRFEGSPGEFTLDSRSGPGAEIWQTDKIIPGTYTVTWKLYNTYGNDKPVTYSGFISSNRGRVNIADATFEAKVGKQKTIKIKADDLGYLSKIN